MDVAIHFLLECTGAATLRCIFGVCEHPRHRFVAWVLFALFSSWLTVQLVG